MTTKVFVGNLSFKIGSDKLREEFAVAGNVLSANIITRGPRSLGYGFVEFANIDDAEKAVSLLNHKDIDGREINVEVAKPRAEPPQHEGEEDTRPPRRPRRRAPRAQGQGQAQGQTQQQGQQGQGQTQQHQQTHQAGPSAPRTRPQGQHQQAQQQGQQGQTQQPRGQGARREYRPRFQSQDNEGQAVNAGRNNSNVVNNNNEERPFRPRTRRPRTRQPRQQGEGQQQQQQPRQQGEGQQQQAATQQFQRKRPAPQPKKQQERVSSSTTLFVANLPFSVDDKELAEIFSKNLKVVSAHVVKKRNTRSKGFGFVEFENEADQQAALKDFDGSTVHERVLNVKVALTAVPGDEADQTETAATGEKEADVKSEPAKESKAEAAAPAEGEKKGQ